MNPFNCFPIALDDKAPLPNEIIDELLSQGQIPIKIITDKNSDDFVELEKSIPADFIPKYFIVVIVYLHTFTE